MAGEQPQPDEKKALDLLASLVESSQRIEGYLNRMITQNKNIETTLRLGLKVGKMSKEQAAQARAMLGQSKAN